MRQPRTGPGAAPGHRERVAQRQADAMRLRTAGASFRQIGERLGVSAMQAHRDVMTALAETVAQRNESAEQLRALEAERLDRITTALWPRAQKGDAEAARVLVRVSERRCRLFGLDAQVAAKLEVTGHTVMQHVVARPHEEMPDEELRRRLRQLGEQLAAEAGAPPLLPADAPPAAVLAAPPPPTPQQEYASVLAARNGGRI